MRRPITKKQYCVALGGRLFDRSADRKVWSIMEGKLYVTSRAVESASTSVTTISML